MSVLDGALAWSGHLVDSAGSLGLAAVMTAEAVLPLPSTVVLPVVGARVSSGELAYVVALLATTAGSVLGSALVYGVARSAGPQGLDRVNRLLKVNRVRAARMEARFARRGALAVLLGRLVPGVRCMISLPAGALRVPLRPFLAATAVGSAIWNGAWIGAGAWLTAHGDAVASAVASVLAASPVIVLPATVTAGALVLLSQTRVPALLARAVR